MDGVVAAGRHLSGLHTRILLDHVRDRLGESGVTALLAGAGEKRPVEVLVDDTTWSSYWEFRPLLEEAARLLAGSGGLEGAAELRQIGRTTGAEFARTMQSLGSPMALVMATAGASDAVFPILAVHPEVLGPTWVRWHRTLRGGFEPFPELCQFLNAVQVQAVRLFGMQVVEITEVSCQCRGDDECVAEVRWDETEDLAVQLALERNKREITESRLEAFKRTVDDIVSATDVDAVLASIVRSAARAMSAPGFVLAVEALAGGTRLYTEGISAETAHNYLGAEADCLSVDVVSARRSYGRLIAVAPLSAVNYEKDSLQAYARLAASALDSAFALEEARRQAQTAQALLELSTSLGELSSIGELSSKLTGAILDVIDCDCSAVMIVNDGIVRVVAHQGYPDEMAPALEGFEMAVEQQMVQNLSRRTPEQVSVVPREWMKKFGIKAMASAPLQVDETTVGLLVAAVRHDSDRILDDSKLGERFSGLAGQASVALRNGKLLDQIRHQSLHDPLTDLPNRALILDRAEQMLARARRNQTLCAAMFIDLDGFKEINDTLGHGAGDELLQQVAARLKATLRANDTVGRLGGDEFVVLSEGASLEAGVEAVADRLLEALHRPFQLSIRERPVISGASIGIATGDRSSAADLLRDADIALYRAKASGKGCHRIFAPEMQLELIARAELGERLADAIVNREFFLVYQPIVDLETEITTGLEALLRWDHPQLGVVPPAKFIPLLEDTGLIVEVGRWVIHEACRQAARLRAAGHNVQMAVNASMRQLERPEFVEDVRHAIDAARIPPSALTIEITETAIMRDTDAAIVVIKNLKAIGVRIAIDDFGTGYSSLAYLRQFPVDSLKIDRSFVEAAAESRAARELIRTVVGLGKSLQLETLAEGIEQRSQLQRLQTEGCASGQGFLFALPLRSESLLSFLDEQKQLAVGFA